MAIPEFIKRSLVSQFILIFVFTISGIIVCTLQTCTILIWPISPKWYRIVNCKLAYLLWVEVVFLCDYWAEIELHIYAERGVWKKFVGNEHGLLVMNHKTGLDFMITWMIADRARILGNCKAIIKNQLRYLPFLGWSFVLLEFIFVTKNITENTKNMIKGFQNYGSYPLNCVTLLFCEGSLFTKTKHEQSIKYAHKQGIEPLKHHLLPRTKGFALCIEGFKGHVPAMYDCCVGYDTVKGAVPTFANLLQGKKMIVHVLCRRVLIDDIPNNTEKECADYCYEMYKKKDEEYEYFLKHKSFEGYDKTKVHQLQPRRKMPLLIASFWLLLLGAPSVYFMAQIVFIGSMWARCLLAGTILTIFILVKLLVWFSMPNASAR